MLKVNMTYNNWTDHYHWKDSSGNDLDPHEYIQLTVVGDTLEPINIKDGDLLFMKEITNFEYSNLTLPKLCIFKRKGEITNEQSKIFYCYVIRKVNVFQENIDAVINEILRSDLFAKYKNDIRYICDDFIKAQFKVPKNCVNISIYPRLNTDNKWILDCVNSEHVWGVVNHCFTVN